MEHYKAQGIYGGTVYAWRSPGSSQINYRYLHEDDQWGPVETFPIPEVDRDRDVSELMEMDWYLATSPVRAS